MTKTIEILETKTLGEWTCTRVIQRYPEKQIPNIIEYIDTDYFTRFLNEFGLGRVEITAEQLEEFLYDAEFNTLISWTEDDIKFIKAVEEISQKEGFVNIRVW